MLTMQHFRLASHLYNRPLLVTPERAQVIESVFRAREDGRAALLSPPPEEPAPRQELAGPGIQRTDAGYFRTADGVAILPVVGTLVQRGDTMDAMSGLIGYNRVAAMLNAAINDPRVDAILLEIDSPGGEANGLMDLAGKVRAASLQKPTWAFANEAAYSAAFWLATSTSKVFTPQTGSVGSVGVVMLHVDQSGKDAKQGVTYTPIFAGAHKVDFSSHAPLSDDARALAQDEVNRLYDLFVAAVADGRGIDEQAVRDTEAGLLNSAKALDVGFIDGVQSFDATLAALAAEAKRYRYSGMRMSADADGRNSQTAADAAERTDMPEAPKGLTADDVTQAHTRGVQEGKTAAEADAAKKLADAEKMAAKAAQDRVLAILGHDEAVGRTALAKKLAATSMSVDDAVELMKSAAKEAPAKADLNSRMPPNPKAGLPAADGGEATASVTRIDSAAVYKRRAEATAAARK